LGEGVQSDLSFDGGQTAKLVSWCRKGVLPLYWVYDFEASAAVICRRYLVDGRVQGVYYRATAARHARELQITGHAVNLPDGRVEVLAYGNETALQELEKRLWAGSSASKVTSVQAAAAPAGADIPTTFITG
jgi:acylphosphatase